MGKFLALVILIGMCFGLSGCLNFSKNTAFQDRSTSQNAQLIVKLDSNDLNLGVIKGPIEHSTVTIPLTNARNLWYDVALTGAHGAMTSSSSLYNDFLLMAPHQAVNLLLHFKHLGQHLRMNLNALAMKPLILDILTLVIDVASLNPEWQVLQSVNMSQIVIAANYLYEEVHKGLLPQLQHLIDDMKHLAMSADLGLIAQSVGTVSQDLVKTLTDKKVLAAFVVALAKAGLSTIGSALIRKGLRRFKLDSVSNVFSLLQPFASKAGDAGSIVLDLAHIGVERFKGQKTSNIFTAMLSPHHVV